MEVAAYAHALEPVVELLGGMLAGIVGDDDGAHHEVASLELVAQSEHVFVVGDAEVGAHLVFLDVGGADDDDDFDAVAQLCEHAQLGVGFETWQHARGVVVVEEFSAELHVELSVELCDALTDVLRLQLDVLVVVESYFHTGGVIMGEMGNDGK